MTKRKAEYIAPEKPKVHTLKCKIGTSSGVANYPDRHSKVARTASKPDNRRALHSGEVSQVGAETVGTNDTLPTSLHVTPADCIMTGHTRSAPVPTTTGHETEYTTKQRETWEALEAFWTLLLEAG